MRHVDEGTIHGWLDSALSADEAAGVEAHVAECAACAATVAEARGLVAASSRILSALDNVPGAVIPAATPASATSGPASSRPPRGFASRYGRLAALLAIVATGTAVAVRMRTSERGGVPSMAMGSAKPESAPAARDSAPASGGAAPIPSAAPTPAPRARVAAKTALPALTRDAQDVAAAAAGAAGAAAAAAVVPASRALDSRVAQAPLPAKVLGMRPTNIDSVRPGTTAGTTRLSEVVTTGTGSADAPSVDLPVRTLTDATLLSTELGATDSRRTRRSAYEVRPGVTVTLVEAAPLPVTDQARVRRQEAARADAARVDPRAPAMHTIVWPDAAGHTFTLTGPLPESELQGLRQRVR